MQLAVIAWLVTVLARLGLELLQLQHQVRHGHVLPRELQGVVGAGHLARVAGYTQDRGRLHLLQSTVLAVVTGMFVFGGGLATYDRWTTRTSASEPQRLARTEGAVSESPRPAVRQAPGAAADGPGKTSATERPAAIRMGLEGGFRTHLAHALRFAAGLFVASLLLRLPFAAWSTFRIETRHGFNRTTRRLWITDQLKGLLLGLLLGGVLLAGAFTLVWVAPRAWWLAVWGLVVAFGLFLTLLSPVLLEPLFLKFRPLDRPDLEAQIRGLAERARLPVRCIVQVDASRRSAHSNAYFTGIGRVKRIVLFDTLLERAAPGEILAVLAHEMGHWKLRHVLRRFLVSAASSGVALGIASVLLPWPGLPQIAGVPAGSPMSLPARALLASFLLSLLALPLAPAESALLRRDERAADRFACRLTGRPLDLAAALATLARDNLSNVHPHPWYAWVHASHPPVIERIRSVQAMATEDDR